LEIAMFHVFEFHPVYGSRDEVIAHEGQEIAAFHTLGLAQAAADGRLPGVPRYPETWAEVHDGEGNRVVAAPAAPEGLLIDDDLLLPF
jgi:hypothetical protein